MKSLSLAEVEAGQFEIATQSGALYWIAGRPGSWWISRTARFGGERSWLTPSDAYPDGHEICRPLPVFEVGAPARLLVLDEALGHGLRLVTTPVLAIRRQP